MADISKHPLLKECYELCLAIEKCGASPELTDASMKASNLMRSIEALVDSMPQPKPLPPTIMADSARHL